MAFNKPTFFIFKYVACNKVFINDLNRIFGIISQSKHLLLGQECDELKQLLTTLNQNG